LFKTILFDCDGVLVDSENISACALSLTLEGFGVTLAKDQIASQLVGKLRSGVDSILQCHLDASEMDRFWSSYYETREQMFDAELEPVEGARLCLEQLSQRGVLLGVVTQAARSKAIRNLARVQLLEYFEDAVYSADQVERPKPWPDLYRHALHDLGALPSGALTVDDREEGILGGLRAGLSTVFFNGVHGRPCDFSWVRTVRNLSEISA